MDDLISRQAAIDALCNDYCGGHQDCKYYPNCENLRSVQKLPSAQPAEPKRGRWIGKYPITSVCSECGFLIHDSKVKAFAYCPNCGADMREKGENSESN